jgi:hypothetical protein
MDTPYQAIAGLAAVSSYVLVTYVPELLPSSKPGYIGTFAQLWSLGFSLSLTWQVILYPKFFSPLRHLPSPKGGSWWNGHFSEIVARPSGEPMKDW